MAKPSRDYKIICDTDRICDVEDSVYDWIKYDSSNQMQNMTI